MIYSHLTYINIINDNKINLLKKSSKSIAIAENKSK